MITNRGSDLHHVCIIHLTIKVYMILQEKSSLTQRSSRFSSSSSKSPSSSDSSESVCVILPAE